MSTHGCTCWEPGVTDDPDCPRHGTDAKLPRLEDLRDPEGISVDETVDLLSDAAADRADTIVDRYDPDDREPYAGDPYWAEEMD